jgi:hypothetical protein
LEFLFPLLYSFVAEISVFVARKNIILAKACHIAVSPAQEGVIGMVEPSVTLSMEFLHTAPPQPPVSLDPRWRGGMYSRKGGITSRSKSIYKKKGIVDIN